MHSVRSTLRTIKEEGRRAEIITATIQTLSEVGYTNTSLAQIAKRASISTSLILYHFKDKDDLIAEVLRDITAKWTLHVRTNVHEADSVVDKLHAYIYANLMYMATQPHLMSARIEIIFNARDPQGKLMFQTESYDLTISMLEEILEQGKREGVFEHIPTRSTAIAIRASIDQFLGLMDSQDFDAERYLQEITHLFDKAIVRTNQA